MVAKIGLATEHPPILHVAQYHHSTHPMPAPPASRARLPSPSPSPSRLPEPEPEPEPGSPGARDPGSPSPATPANQSDPQARPEFRTRVTN